MDAQTNRADKANAWVLGTVVASSDRNDPLLSRKVFLVPTRGWDSDPYGPESKCQRSLSAFSTV